MRKTTADLSDDSTKFDKADQEVYENEEKITKLTRIWAISFIRIQALLARRG